ncbi:(p)ppGpp synthetase [Photobacterium sanctipauli]|uniref:(P)ppGpp synthetase n=1 Tax=Photobacterium sanctipauli TaxID=1342794 RepID=A0A2T3NIJ4_9GAMM|nr:RelA/SpoT domain-containing protein [Photobacterium sanctipauli]PSW14801.1 (p)ppGpp synthetase [Photobacterium sanctipauli]
MSTQEFHNQKVVAVVQENMHHYELLKDRLESILVRDKTLKKLIHSLKYRFKDMDHLDEKITRKNEELDRKGEPLITPENVFDKITDIAGVRALHLHMSQFASIHSALMQYVENGELALYEAPKAYSWDPEYVQQFRELGIDAQHKDSLYTSVHYVFKFRPDNPYTCELQVRTLFEEVWGEIDHTVNYPVASENLAIQEQLKVLARVVSAGTRLSDSIFKVQAEVTTNRE